MPQSTPPRGMPDREEIRRRLEGFLNPPLTLAGTAIALLIVCQIAAPLGGWAVPLWVIAAVLYGMILLEFTSKLSLARDRAAYLRAHWIEAVYAVLPVLRPLTYLRHLRVYRVVEALFELFFGKQPSGRTARLGMQILRRRQLGKLALSSLMLTLIFAELFYLAEIHAKGTQISSFGGALWFASSTITTVGSEIYPVTLAGRLIGWALMIYAVTVFTYLAASLASVMVGGDSQQSDSSEQSDSSQPGAGPSAAQQSEGSRAAPQAPVGGGSPGSDDEGTDPTASGTARAEAAASGLSDVGVDPAPTSGDAAAAAEQAWAVLHEVEQLLAQAHAMLGRVSAAPPQSKEDLTRR